MRILLIVVNFNQEKEILNFLLKLKNNFSVEDTVIVDDGSTDRSVEIATELTYNVLKHIRNEGVGATVRTGLMYGLSNNYEAALIMSSNGKLKPEEIPLLINPVIEKKADYVTGSRFIKKGSSQGLGWFRHVGIKIFSLLAYPLLGKYFSDITCGFRCYKLDFISNLNIEQDWLNKYEMEYYIHYFACKQKLRIVEVPVTVQYSHLEKRRRSHIRPITGWWSMLRPLLYLKAGIMK